MTTLTRPVPPPVRPVRRARRRTAAAVVGVLVVAAVLLAGLLWLADASPAAGPPSAGPRVISVTQPHVAAWAGPTGRIGADASFPQCGRVLPATSFAVVGVTGGSPFTANPCLVAQWGWARAQGGSAVYVNVDDPGTQAAVPYGQAIAADALARMARAGVPAGVPVWLDVETANRWTADLGHRRTVIAATAAALAAAGHPVGVYAGMNGWAEITEDVATTLPTWMALSDTSAGAGTRACALPGFGGQRPSMVQWVATEPDGHALDHDLLCRGVPAAGVLAPPH